MLTVWGADLDVACPRPEYPRPQLVRDSYLCLNGRWDYAITSTTDQPTCYDGQIVVPFSPESVLSGVRRTLRPDEVLHYRRRFTLPAGFVQRHDERVLVHLDAVDQWCQVAVNGHVLGEHHGGYLPVTLDVTDRLVATDNELTVCVRDPTETGHGARGKQRLDRGGIWYTPQSGIWQTVWAEAVPAVAVERLAIDPDTEAGSFTVTVHLLDRHRGRRPSEPECSVVLRSGGRVVARGAGPAATPLTLSLLEPRLWSPQDPHLYDIDVAVGHDRVTSFAGLRSFDVGPDADGQQRLLLNGRPYFHAGVLDQGYWPDGLYTAPSDEAMVHDIATMKRLGFTMLRKHLKIEPLRWYYHCDRLGMLVWQDMVNGGGPYPSPVVTGPAFLPVHLSDRRHRLFGRSDAVGRSQWLRELAATIEHLRNVVSIAVWVPFNEGWGQFHAAWVAEQVRRLDPSRSIDHASGWHDQAAGDLTSRHVYVKRLRLPRRRAATARRALALSEYGGYSLPVREHSASPQSFGYRAFADPESLAEAFRALHAGQVQPAIDHGLAASVYTQLSDVEDETNGLLTYDRRVQKLPDEVVQAVTARLRLT